MSKAREVWMVTFESKPYVKVGGLGEVPPNLAVELVSLGVNVTIVMPRHGIELDCDEEFRLTHASICVKVWRGVRFLLLGGGVLDKPGVYDPATMFDKVVKLAQGLRELVLRHEDAGLRLPEVIHFHDWHSVYSLLHAKLALEEIRARAALVYHIHLLTRERVTEDQLRSAGIDLSAVHWIVLGGRARRVTVSEALQMSRGFAERLGSIESDVFVTVSESYLKVDRDGVLNTLGWDLEEKSAVVYNGTDWEYGKVLKEVLDRHKHALVKEGAGTPPSRSELRRYLLLRALGDMPPGEPKVPDPRIRAWLEERYAPPFLTDGRVEPFRTDGPLAIMTGRVARQKGVDVLAEAVPHVLRKLGTAKFLLLLLPVWGGEEYFQQLIDLARDYPENVRVIFGVAPSVYKLAHVAADLSVVPSRWEPFGIVALEAMASGTPVVASEVGGLREIVLDVRKHGAAGTGLHVPPDDPYELAWAITDMLLLVEAANSRNERLIDKIGDEKLRERAYGGPLLGEKVREACMRRVRDEFTWEKSASRALEVYARATSASELRPL